MQNAIKLTSTSGFDGTTLLAPPYPTAGADGIFAITAASVGLIDPDFSSATPTPTAANQTLLLQSFLIKLGASGVTGDGLDVVDADGNVAYRIKDFSTLTTSPFTFFGDRRWIIPAGYRLKVKGAGPSAVLRLSIWTVTELQDLEMADPAST